jgi:hypothetical protein
MASRMAVLRVMAVSSFSLRIVAGVRGWVWMGLRQTSRNADGLTASCPRTEASRHGRVEHGDKNGDSLTPWRPPGLASCRPCNHSPPSWDQRETLDREVGAAVHADAG